MDGNQFDAWAKALGGSGSRRASFRLLVGAAAAGGLTRLGLADVAAACKKPGKKCDKNSECCSKRCRQGRCRCAKATKPCAENADCCNTLICGRDSKCAPGPACTEAGQMCTGSSECCSGDCVAGTCCGEAGTCCQPPSESCTRSSDCCFGGTECEALPNRRAQRCCLRQGASCLAFPEACCNGLVCHQITGQCVPIGGISTCKHARATCHESDECCDSLDCCGAGCCGGLGCSGDKRCCKWPGRSCELELDCCWGAEFDANNPGDFPDDPVTTCQAGTNGQKRCCVREGHHCAGHNAAPGAICCNGLVCDAQNTEKCVKFGIGT